MQRSPNRAFSLIELLIVVTIIALLAAILFPVFAQAKRRAVQTTCLSNLRQMGVAIGLCQAENGELLPSGKLNHGPQPSRDMLEPLRAYAKSAAILRCPLGHHDYPARWVVQVTSPSESRLMLPAANNAIARCIHHLDTGWSTGSDWESIVAPEGQRGNHVALMGDLSARTLDAQTVRPMKRVVTGGKEEWIPMPRFMGSMGGEDGYGVYTSEEWPPRWHTLPESAPPLVSE